MLLVNLNFSYVWVSQSVFILVFEVSKSKFYSHWSCEDLNLQKGPVRVLSSEGGMNKKTGCPLHCAHGIEKKHENVVIKKCNHNNLTKI